MKFITEEEWKQCEIRYAHWREQAAIQGEKLYQTAARIAMIGMIVGVVGCGQQPRCTPCPTVQSTPQTLTVERHECYIDKDGNKICK